MKRETIEKRIRENLFTKKGTLRCIYEEALWWLSQRPQDRIHPKRWGFTSLINKSERYLDVLDALGIDYIVSNDAPRHGKTGYYIELTKKGLRQISQYHYYHMGDRWGYWND